MPDNILGGQGSTLLTAVIIVSVALLALVGVFWLIRARSASTFIRGGKNRQPRLAVLDAAAVDTRRRLVLIRRDDVEHLVMIGGPTDIVIESGIGQDQSSAPPQQPRQAAPQPAPSPQPAPAAQPAPSPRPAPTLSPQPAPSPRPAPSAAPAPSPRPATSPTPVATADPKSGWSDRAPSPEPARPPSPPRAAQPASPAATAAVTAGSVGSIRAKAADVLESARTRVFEEPSFDAEAFDELTASPASPPYIAHVQPTYAPPTPAPPTNKPSRAAEPPRHVAAAAPAASDFESVLAAELSGDLSFGPDDDGFLDPPLQDAHDETSQSAQDETPEVKPDTHPSRDSLEAEMERLLGDLSRKP